MKDTVIDSMPRFARLVLAAAAIGIAPTVALAQKTVEVFYVHTPFTEPEKIRLYYRMPGWDTARVASGLAFGDRLTVMEGGQMCFRVKQPNPMLYVYGSTSEVVPVSPPEGLAAIAKAVTGPGGLVGMTLTTRGQSARSRGDSGDKAIAEYSEAVTEVLKVQGEMEALRLRDDGNWAKEMTDLTQLSEDARQAITNANRRFDAAEKTNPDQRQKEVLSQIWTLQALSKARISAIEKEFADADKLREAPLCTRIGRERRKATLSVKSRLKEVKDLNYAVKDNLVEIELDPQSDVAFEVGAGAVIGTGVDRKKFSLRDGLIVSEQDEEPIVRPGAFALGRLWPLGWLWAGIGIAKSDEATPDLSFGLVARPGLSLAGTQLSVGAGLGLFRVPVGLKGAEVGKALPSEIKNIDEVIDRGYRSGLSITFSLSGS